jgi:PAS domain S-box-containing protein
MQNLLRRQVSGQEELRYNRQDGTPRWVSISLTPVQDEAGQVQQFILVGSDITDKKKKEKALARALEEISSAQD